LKTKTDFS
jgi:hypothetical protein